MGGFINELADKYIESGIFSGNSTTKTSLWTLTERKAREQIIIKIKQTTHEAIKEALDGLEKKYGADVNVKANDGGTALMVASQKGHIEIVRLLKEAGAR